MVALSQMATFLAVEQKFFYGDIVTPCSVTCENVRIVVIARDEKTAPPISARLQKGHCICIRNNILPLKVSSSYSLSSLPSVTWLMLVFFAALCSV